MRLVTATEMRGIEERAALDYGLTGDILMENAAMAAVRYLLLRRGPGPARTAIFCGKGNNGGDGWAMARLLMEEGWTVRVFHPGLGIPLSPEAEANRDRALAEGISQGTWEDGIGSLADFDLIVDALLGTGVRGDVGGQLLQVILAINRVKLPVFSLDIPSGVASDTGQIAGEAIKARWTVAFGLMKLGEAVFPGKEYCGELWVDPIGIPSDLLEAESSSEVITEIQVGRGLPRRPIDAHKGTHGHLLVLGGSEGMTGAVALCGLAALRSGAGLVTIGKRPELMIYDKPMEIITRSWIDLHPADYSVVVFGPGLSKAADGAIVLERVLAAKQTPRVIDADGLNLLAEHLKEEKEFHFSGSIILTPHPGEMARLCGCSTREIQARRAAIAREKAREWNAVVVLKGAATVVATPEGKLWVNPTGNPGMATAGTGDVLAGVIGSLLAQGLRPEDAAVAGVYLHGAAGDWAMREVGDVGIIASDLVGYLPRVLRSVKECDAL